MKKLLLLFLFWSTMCFGQVNLNFRLPWTPDKYTPIKTIRVRFNVVQDANGNGNYKETNALHVAHLQRIFNNMNNYATSIYPVQSCNETNNPLDSRIRLQLVGINYIKNNTLYNKEIVNQDNCPGPTNYLQPYNEQLEASNTQKAINIYFHNPPSCFSYYQSRGFVEQFDANGKSITTGYCTNTLQSDGIPGGCSILPTTNLADNSYMLMNATHLDYERKKASYVGYRTVFNNPNLFWDESGNNGSNDNVYNWAVGIWQNTMHELVHALISDEVHRNDPNCQNLMNISYGGTYLTQGQLGSMHYSLSNLNSEKYVVENFCQFNAATPITISGNVTWNTNRNVNSNITIPSGAVLNINSKIALAAGSTILVQSGGTLNINSGGVLNQNCCSTLNGLTFDIKGILNVNNGGTLVLKQGYNYLVYGTVNMLSGAFVNRIDNTSFNNQSGAVVNQSSTSNQCLNYSPVSTTLANGNYKSANAISLSNSNLISTSTFSSTKSITLTPLMALQASTGSLVFSIGSNNCVIESCLSQPQFRTETTTMGGLAYETHDNMPVNTNSAIDYVEKTNIHPNPISSGKLNFGKKVGNFILMNSIGEIVLKGSDMDNIDITNLAKGVYLIKFDSSTETVIIK